MIITRFLMTIRLINLLEHHNQNNITCLIIDYLSLIKSLIQLLGLN
ncbi:unnamed protein product, partial [Rotaria sordida]